MLLVFPGRIAQDGLPLQPPDRGEEPPGWWAGRRRIDHSVFGFAGSILLHLLVILLLLFGLPGPGQPPALDMPIPIALVSAGAPTQSPPADEQAPLPRAPADSTSPQAPPTQVAEAPPPPPKDKPNTAGVNPHVDPLADIVPPKKPPPPVVGMGAQFKPAHSAPRPAVLPPSDTPPAPAFLRTRRRSAAIPRPRGRRRTT